MKKAFAFMSIAALAVVLAAPLPAQTVSVQANVPFDFVVAGRTMPAGEYELGTLTQSAILAVRGASHSPAITTTISSTAGKGRHGEAYLVFHRYGNQYFLSQVWDGFRFQGREIPISRTERELASRASISQPEIVMVLARL